MALAVLGFATKAGLAPMHSWLPDAHSQAPAPVSGLMSGVLLSVALYAILRIQAIGDAVLGPEFLRGLLVAGGLLSLAVAAALMLAQRDYKRLLAYSQHRAHGHHGPRCRGRRTVATTAVLLHMLGHGLVKAAMFVVAGRDPRRRGQQPHRRRPRPAGPPARPGPTPAGRHRRPARVPPVRAVLHRGGHRRRRLADGLGWAMAIALLLLLVVFAGLGRQVAAMTLGVTNGRSR